MEQHLMKLSAGSRTPSPNTTSPGSHTSLGPLPSPWQCWLVQAGRMMHSPAGAAGPSTHPAAPRPAGQAAVLA